MDRLSGLDASFLYLESSAQLLHVCGVIVLDPETIPGGYDFEQVQGRARATDRRRADVPPQAQAGAARHRPPGLGHRRRLRHRPARAPDGAAVARRRPRARRPVRAHGRHPAGPVPPAVGVRDHRGPRVGQGRDLHQDAPLHGRRRVRRERHLLPVQPRARRSAARDGAQGRHGLAYAGRRGAVRSRRPHQPRQAGGGGQAGRPDRRRTHQDHRPCPQRHGDGCAPDAHRAPRSTAPSPVTGPSRSRTCRWTRSRRSRTPSRGRRSTTSSSPCAAARCVATCRSVASCRTTRWSPRCRSRCAASRSTRAAATRSPRSSPGSAPTSRTRSTGCPGLRGQHQRQGPPQGDPGRHPPGLGRVRCPAHVRARRTDGVLAAPRRLRSGDPQPGDLQRARVRRCRCTSSARRSRASTRSARSSTAPASTSR